MIAEGKKLGRYEIRSQIGVGGMGEVFLAEDMELERSVALKVLPADLAGDSERVNRFVQEARAASALNHPNILTIHEIGSFEDFRFIASEYIKGETLRDKLENKPLRLSEILEIVVQVASALQAAHQAGIVHRDIKPENVMIREDSFVKVLDFGLAKLTERKQTSADSEDETRALVKTSPGVIMGTAGYMSPEQAQGKTVDERTDIWSLGVCLYEMLSGKQPFAGKTINHTIVEILEKEPAPLDENLPPELLRIVKKTLQKDAEKRYQTSKDLLIDLKEVKHESEFQNKLEKTAPPLRTEAKTGVHNATTAGTHLQTVSSAEYVVSEIKSHKLGFTIGLVILLLATVGAGYWLLNNRTSNTAQIESIAVLPFENQNPETEYLSDGLTESVINNLTKLPNLRVITRNSVFRYKGKETDLAAAGRELNVQSVLTGRIIQLGDSLIISAELTDLRDNKQIWGQQYNRKLTDTFALQQEISKNISEILRSKLTGEERERLARRETVSPEAYQLYLKGRFHWNKRKPEEHKKAIQYFEQAIALDPNYALAYAGIADCYAVSSSPVKGQERVLRLRAAANKALELDPSLGEPHAALANAFWTEWNWSGAESQYKRAIELNPNYATAHQWYAELLSRLGRHDEAISEIKHARELDPLSLIINSDMIYILIMARRYDEAIEQGKRTLEMDASWTTARYFISIAYLYKGMYEEFIAEAEKAIEFRDWSAEKKEARRQELAALRDAYRKSGARGFWQKMLELENEYLAKGEEEESAVFMAEIYANLGEKDEALKQLEKSVEKREEDIDLIKVHPSFDNLRNDPRFQELLRRMNLAP